MLCKLAIAFVVGVYVGKHIPSKERTDTYLSRMSRRVGRVIAEETLDEFLPREDKNVQ